MAQVGLASANVGEDSAMLDELGVLAHKSDVRDYCDYCDSCDRPDLFLSFSTTKRRDWTWRYRLTLESGGVMSMGGDWDRRALEESVG